MTVKTGSVNEEEDNKISSRMLHPAMGRVILHSHYIQGKNRRPRHHVFADFGRVGFHPGI